MFEIRNSKGRVVACGHRRIPEAQAWIRWALTVRPGEKYTIVRGDAPAARPEKAEKA